MTSYKYNPLVTIIVPVYNVEKYLKKCVNSILNQTYENIEIILVDDGSMAPDTSAIICDEYAKKDERIKVIHKTNGGLSSARNVGLDIAKGDYIYFVDSDDWIDKNTIKDNITILTEKKADIICFNYHVVDEFGNYLKSGYTKIKEEFSDELLRSGLYKGNFSCIVCNKIYKKSLWENLRFPIGLKFEDSYILPDILAKAEKIIGNDNYYYYYFRGNNNSITHTTDQITRQYIVIEILLHKLEIVEKFYKSYYNECLKDIIKEYLKIYNMNCFLKFAKKEEVDLWKCFINKYYEVAKNKISFRERILIFCMNNNLKFINYLKGFEYYIKMNIRSKNDW